MEASATTPAVATSASLTTPNQTAATPSTLAPSGGAKPKKVQTSIQSFFNTNEEQMDLSENRRREREEAGSPGEEPPPKRTQSDSMITNTSIGVMNSPISEMMNEATENIDEVFPVIQHTETVNNFAPEAISRNTDILLEEAYSLVALPSPVPAIARSNPRSPSPDLESTPISKSATNIVLAPKKPPCTSVNNVEQNAKYDNLVMLITANAESISSNASQIKAILPEFTAVKSALAENRQLIDNISRTVEELATDQQSDRTTCQNRDTNNQNKVNGLEAAFNELRARIVALESQNPIINNQLNDLHHRLPSQEQVQSLQNELQFRSDQYYLATISVKGFHRNEVQGKSPRKAAVAVLETINAQQILSTAKLISVKEHSIRITFDSIVEMKRALAIAGGCIALIRRQGANTGLKFSQLTPPRFSHQRLNLFLQAKNQKNAGNIKYWHFAVSKGELIIQATKNDGSKFTIPQNGEPMETEMQSNPRSASAECSICTAQFNSAQPISQLNCGHRFHTLCARTQMGRDIRCPTCRQKPHLFNIENIDCAECLGEPADERDDNAIFVASRKCAHLHLRVCQDSHMDEIRETPDQFQFTAIGTDELRNSDKPGCVSCKNHVIPIHSTSSYISPVPFTQNIQTFQEPREPNTRGTRRARVTNTRRTRQ